MHQDHQVESKSRTEFEPSELVEYGDAREHTRNSPTAKDSGDGSAYHS